MRLLTVAYNVYLM